MALIDSGTADETGHPIVRQAMTQEQAWMAAMQGLSHEVLDKEPDVILFISAFFASKMTLSLLRKSRLQPKIVILHSEAPYEDDKQVMRGAYAHLNLLNDEVSVPRFRQLSRAEYMPHAYAPHIHFPRVGPPDPEIASDFVFIGSAFASRKTFFESMAAKLNGTDILIGGADWGSLEPDSPLIPYVGTIQGAPDCVDNPQVAALYRNSKTGINFYRRESEEGALQGVSMGPREVEMAACGLWFCRDPRPESDATFPMLPSFSSPEEAAELIRWALAHDREREEAAAKARAAIEGRTFENNARRFLALAEKLLGSWHENLAEVGSSLRKPGAGTPFPVGTTATATCPAGTTVTGGGFDAGSAAGTAVGGSAPSGNGWTATMTGGPAGQVLTAYAICGKVG